MKRPYSLPNMSMLVSFEAAGRYSSFKTAAEELNVTPAAVSHQVKALEKELRVSLFRRHHRGVELTEAGAVLLVSLQRSFRDMDFAVGEARATSEEETVSISATTAVSALWLSSRLAEFWRSNPDVGVVQIVNDGDTLSAASSLSIQYGRMGHSRFESRILFQDEIFALCSPRFREKHGISSVEELAKVPMIHLDADHANWTRWQEWCAAQGYTGPLQNTYRVNNYMIALQAAEDDVGAVLGWSGLVQGLVDAGRLVPLLPDPIPSPNDFFIALHTPQSQKARLVFDWISGG